MNRLKLKEQEYNLLKDILNKEEVYLINRLKLFRLKLETDNFKFNVDKEFCQSQIYFYENELINLKGLQIQLL